MNVHDNSKFIYRTNYSQAVQRFMIVDYIPVLSILATIIPTAFHGLLFMIPMAIIAVFINIKIEGLDYNPSI